MHHSRSKKGLARWEEEGSPDLGGWGLDSGKRPRSPAARPASAQFPGDGNVVWGSAWAGSSSVPAAPVSQAVPLALPVDIGKIWTENLAHVVQG